mmetsp:Transcript_15217/g.45756  ORF Transcript_15217/g.45756 Transcript_15217/m.45756 type:complete len:272 (-) Transcript_15217:224-1039(-)
MLTIRVLQGRNLKNVALAGKPDPYVKVRAGNSEARTDAKSGTLAPTYNVALEFEGVSASDEVTVMVMDSNAVGKDKLMGSCRIPASDWKASPRNGGRWFSLVAANNRTSAGEIELQFAYKRATAEVGDVNFRPVWRLLGVWAARTSLFTTPYHGMIESGLDTVLGVVLTAYEKATSFYNAQSRNALMMYGGGVVVALMAVSAVLAIPAMLLFPFTLLALMLVGFAGGLLGPLVLIAAWVLGCSTPVRMRLVNPMIGMALEYEFARKLLLED